MPNDFYCLKVFARGLRARYSRGMATKTIKVDDLDGSEGEIGTVPFSFGGRDYEIDLSVANLDKLSELLMPYIKAGRAVGGAGISRRNASAGRKGDGVARPGAGAWKKATYGKAGSLTAEQAAEWDALPDTEKAKWQS